MPFQFITRTSSQPVADFVEAIWYACGQVPYRQERILPNGRPVLIINLGSPLRTSIGAARAFERVNRDAWVVGTLTHFLTNEPLAETHVLGVTFRPWGAGAVLGMPGIEICDRIEEADYILGGGAHSLRERLGEEPNPSRKLDILEAALRDRLSVPDDSGFRTAVFAARMLERPMAPRIGALSTELGISRKHLNALFQRHVGVSPKAFSRLCRFKHSLEALAAGPCSLDELALAHGYYDQAHFNRDFSRFSGLHPTAYLARRHRFLAENEDSSGLFVPEGER